MAGGAILCLRRFQTMDASTEHIKWLAKQDAAGLHLGGQRVVVGTHEGNELTRGDAVHQGGLGPFVTISVNGMEFTTWPVGEDSDCWLDRDGRLVYIYRESLDS